MVAELKRHMCEKGADEHPGAVIVGLDEGERKRVPVLDVEDPGDELEQDPTDQQGQRQALQGVGGTADWRPLEQPRE